MKRHRDVRYPQRMKECQVVGEGVYLLSEAAAYAKVPLATARSWFKPRADGVGKGPIFHSDYAAISDDFAISFLNLVEIHVARFFRQEGVKPPVIRRAREILEVSLGTPHPFAHKDLGTDGKRILRHEGGQELFDVVSKQHFFGQMALANFKYSPATKLAAAWTIEPGVILDPNISYGKPVIEHTGTTTFVVANQYRANKGNARLIAGLFGLSEDNVLQAVHFENGLRKQRAA